MLRPDDRPTLITACLHLVIALEQLVQERELDLDTVSPGDSVGIRATTVIHRVSAQRHCRAPVHTIPMSLTMNERRSERFFVTLRLKRDLPVLADEHTIPDRPRVFQRGEGMGNTSAQTGHVPLH